MTTIFESEAKSDQSAEEITYAGVIEHLAGLIGATVWVALIHKINGRGELNKSEPLLLRGVEAIPKHLAGVAGWGHRLWLGEDGAFLAIHKQLLVRAEYDGQRLNLEMNGCLFQIHDPGISPWGPEF